MYTKLGRILGLALVLVGVTSLVAYDLAASSIEGKIVATSADRITVEIPSGTRMVFVSDPQTMIMASNESKRLVDLKVGDRIRVEYTAAGSTNTATDIEVVTLKAPNPYDSHADGTGTDTARNTGAGYDSNRNMGTTSGSGTADSTGSPDHAGSMGSTGSTGSAYDANHDADSGQLPRTASSVPLVGLIGLLLVGAAVGVRVFRMMIS